MDDSRSKTWQTFGAALIVGAITGAAWFAVNTPSEQRPAAVAATVVEPAPASAAHGGDIAALMEVKPAPVESPPPLVRRRVARLRAGRGSAPRWPKSASTRR